MKRIYLYILLGIVVLGSVGYLFISGSDGQDGKYRTEKVTRGDVVMQVRATGTINPIQTVKVGSQVSGTIAKLYADFNDEVRKGEVIAQIDSTFLSASVKEAEANLERNQAQVNEAKRTLDRTSELFKKDLVSQADMDAAQTGYEAALAQLKQSRAALDRAKVNLRFAIIRAPIDGVIISRDVDVGQTVAASLQAPQLFTIANDLQNMRVEASVDEADIGQIKEDQSVTFTVDSYPEEQFRGRVSQVRLAPVTVQNVVTYTVIIDVPNPDLKLRPGMTATVSILVAKRENVLRVPTLALRFQPPADAVEEDGAKETADTTRRQTAQRDQQPQSGDGGSVRMRGGEEHGNGRRQRGEQGGGGMQGGRRQMAKIWILQDGKTLKPISIRTGLNDSRFVEVMGGDLKEGDEVILSAIGGETAQGMTGGQTNPFQQRMPGGGGGGGRRGF